MARLRSASEGLRRAFSACSCSTLRPSSSSSSSSSSLPILEPSTHTNPNYFCRTSLDQLGERAYSRAGSHKGKWNDQPAAGSVLLRSLLVRHSSRGQVRDEPRFRCEYSSKFSKHDTTTTTTRRRLLCTYSSDTPKFFQIFEVDEVVDLLQRAHAKDICVVTLKHKNWAIADHFVIATGMSREHLQRIARGVLYVLKQKCKEVAPGLTPRIDGGPGSDWIAVDAGK